MPIDASFFQTFVNIQGGFAFFVALLDWPAARLARSAQQRVAALSLPAFFAHRVRDRENVGDVDPVVAGHVDSAVVAVSSFSRTSKGSPGSAENLWIASAIVIGSMVWILLLALLSQTISALVKWRVIASGALLGIVFYSFGFW